jgi:tetrahydromethanopterin S-methyltransferase subunit E
MALAVLATLIGEPLIRAASCSRQAAVACAAIMRMTMPLLFVVVLGTFWIQAGSFKGAMVLHILRLQQEQTRSRRQKA